MAYNSIDDINKILKEYENAISTKIDNLAYDLSKQGAKTLRNTNEIKKGTGKYKRGWRVKGKRQGNDITYVIYNSTQPSLTHLLEYGHDIYNKKGGKKYGVVKPYPHIEPVNKQVDKSFWNGVKEIIEESGKK